jgi:hypothetical protein
MRNTNPEFLIGDITIMSCPTEEKTIWRYVDLAKFVSMLATRSLFFASPFSLAASDKWEAAYPLEFLLAHGNAGIKPIERVRAEWDRELRRVFINCWHVNERESAAMWKLYSSGLYTLAIRSTVGGFKEACEGTKVYVHWVNYIDYDKEKQAWNNFTDPLFTKRKSFQHENELRAVTYLPEPQADVAGIPVPVDLSTLLERIVVSPYDPPWLQGVVKSLLDKYDLGNVPIETSELNAPSPTLISPPGTPTDRPDNDR